MILDSYVSIKYVGFRWTHWQLTLLPQIDGCSEFTWTNLFLGYPSIFRRSSGAYLLNFGIKLRNLKKNRYFSSAEIYFRYWHKFKMRFKWRREFRLVWSHSGSNHVKLFIYLLTYLLLISEYQRKDRSGGRHTRGKASWEGWRRGGGCSNSTQVNPFLSPFRIAEVCRVNLSETAFPSYLDHLS